MSTAPAADTPHQRAHPSHIRSTRAFALLGVLFMAVFGVVSTLLALDQQQVLAATERLRNQTVPDIIRLQRLGRNLEQLRHEGERVFSSSTAPSRQQALLVATLLASHPSMLEHPQAAALARDTERFLVEAARRAGPNESTMQAHYPDWQQLSTRLSLLVDDVMIEGVNHMSSDLQLMTGVTSKVRYELIASLMLVGGFVALFMWLLHQRLILPLQRIDHELSRLNVHRPAPEFAPSSMSEIRAVEQAIGRFHASLQDNEAARQQLEIQANHDGLTGLFNRRHFMVMAEKELHRAQRYRRPVTVGMADLDFFKRINDTHGHAAGDTVLRDCARLLQETLRKTDLVCRYGGEEFAFVFPESTLEDARRLAERFRQQVAAHVFELPCGGTLHTSISIGLAQGDDTPIELALRNADDALYQAKHSGRNQVIAVASANA